MKSQLPKTNTRTPMPSTKPPKILNNLFHVNNLLNYAHPERKYQEERARYGVTEKNFENCHHMSVIGKCIPDNTKTCESCFNFFCIKFATKAL